jgi:26S proteasome regulatory subunit N5
MIWFPVKIYVEVERARLTHKLAKMKEEEGNITEAANVIQELQVETYGSMEKREKVSAVVSVRQESGIRIL